MKAAMDWHGLMRAGLHGLGLAPAQFWALTPVELRVMMGRDQHAAPITRARLDELAACFPDCPGGTRSANRPATEHSECAEGLAE